MDDVGIQKMVPKSAHLRMYLQKVQAEILSEKGVLPVPLKNYKRISFKIPIQSALFLQKVYIVLNAFINILNYFLAGSCSTS